MTQSHVHASSIFIPCIMVSLATFSIFAAQEASPGGKMVKVKKVRPINKNAEEMRLAADTASECVTQFEQFDKNNATLSAKISHLSKGIDLHTQAIVRMQADLDASQAKVEKNKEELALQLARIENSDKLTWALLSDMSMRYAQGTMPKLVKQEKTRMIEQRKLLVAILKRNGRQPFTPAPKASISALEEIDSPTIVTPEPQAPSTVSSTQAPAPQPAEAQTSETSWSFWNWTPWGSSTASVVPAQPQQAAPQSPAQPAQQAAQLAQAQQPAA